MLKSLYIKNYALIDSLEMDFDSGFSVITGETGAGKSIILGALSLILGQRADIKSIKQGEIKCIIEGTFDVSNYDLKQFCEESNIDFDPNTYILRREILSTGKSRAFINDTPVSITDLKNLGSLLIDIHSQHQNLLLGDSKFQMQVVDLIANTVKELTEYKNTYAEYRRIVSELNEQREQASKNRDDEDYLRFQFETISEAKLTEGEQRELEQERDVLNHAEDIKTALFKISSLLSDDERGVVSSLKESLNAAHALSNIYSQADDIVKRLDTAYIDLKDLSQDVERFAGDVEFNPERAGFVEQRLDIIYTLQQKYKVSTVEELIGLCNDFEEKLKNIDSYDERIEELEKKLHQAEEGMLKAGGVLTKKRKSATKEIEKQLVEKINYLGMPNTRFECQFTAKSHPDASGLDDLEFMFSANKNIPLQPIADVASGGEISRVMLCLKSMIAGATAMPTIIFDEIDTGVSGEVADKMGQIMQEFGSKMQVIAITHLPQIAAKGKAHYFVYKDHEGSTTTTNLKKLTIDERIKEIAQMLSGAKVTDAAIENAKEMLVRTSKN